MGKKKKNKGGGGGAGAAAAGQGSTASVMPRRNRLSATRGPRVAAELTALHQKKDWKGVVAMEEDQAELIFPAQQCTKDDGVRQQVANRLCRPWSQHCDDKLTGIY